MFGLGMGELLVIGAVVLLLFGGKKLPALGRGLAEGIKNFQAGLHGSKDDHKNIEASKDDKKDA